MSYVIKFQAPFERLKYFTDDPDIALRRAIILQAIIDASNNTVSSKLRKNEIEAKAWLFGNSDYFQQICYEAGFEPNFIVKITKATIKYNNKKTYKSSINKDKDQEYEKLNKKVYKCC